MKKICLEEMRFDNAFVRELPADPIEVVYPRQVQGACYSRVLPTPVRNPRILAFSPETAEMLGLSPASAHSDAFRDVFSGNRILDGMDPFAMCYGGHQFGHWVGQLGDGRAINLGEVVCEGDAHATLQLKGAGLTPYSRRADGLAVVRSSLREFLCSEGMHHLGVPTTRALSLIATGEDVMRDMFYDGHPAIEPGAIVCRVAPSFVRFGNFEIFASRADTIHLERLVHYTLRRDFPEFGEPTRDVYSAWFAEVCRRTARLMVDWQRLGFVHGVMNTDNMSIVGLTLDYGPYGWLDHYDPRWTPNTTDAKGKRYRYEAQPDVALWNLAQLGNALYPLILSLEPLQAGLDEYTAVYTRGRQKALTDKFGFADFTGSEDQKLFDQAFVLLEQIETDMSIFFRKLSDVQVYDETIDVKELRAPLLDAYYSEHFRFAPFSDAMDAWIKLYARRSRGDAETQRIRKERMDRVNPKFVFRNYLAQQCIDAAEQGNLEPFDEVYTALRQPYCEQPEKEHLSLKRPEWARNKAGCSMLSCSS